MLVKEPFTYTVAFMIQGLFQYLANYILEFRHAKYVILFILILLQYSSAFLFSHKSIKLKTERKMYFAECSDKQRKRKVLLRSFMNGHMLDLDGSFPDIYEIRHVRNPQVSSG